MRTFFVRCHLHVSLCTCQSYLKAGCFKQQSDALTERSVRICAVIHLTDTRLKLQGRRRRKWQSSCCAALACCNGFNRWMYVVFLEEVGLTRTACPRCALFCSSHKGLLYGVCVCGRVCLLGNTHTHTHNTGDTTTVYRPKACYDVVNIESCVGGFVAFSAGTDFCKTQWARSVFTHSHTHTLLM